MRVFSDFAIWYLFLAGTAGGAFLCATVTDVRANPGWDARRVPLCARCGMFGAFGLLALAALMLFCDGAACAEGLCFEEIGAKNTSSSAVKLLFDAPKGAEMEVRVLGHSAAKPLTE